jgi:hypothetical protein
MHSCIFSGPYAPLPRWGLNVAELRTKRLPSLDGRGWGRVETSDVQHPHPTSPVKGEELDSTTLTSPVEGEELDSAVSELFDLRSGREIHALLWKNPKLLQTEFCSQIT